MKQCGSHQDITICNYDFYQQYIECYPLENRTATNHSIEAMHTNQQIKNYEWTIAQTPNISI